MFAKSVMNQMTGSSILMEANASNLATMVSFLTPKLILTNAQLALMVALNALVLDSVLTFVQFVMRKMDGFSMSMPPPVCSIAVTTSSVDLVMVPCNASSALRAALSALVLD